MSWPLHIIEKSQGRNSDKAGTETEIIEERCILSSFLWLTQFAFLDITCPEIGHRQWTGPSYTDWPKDQSDGSNSSTEAPSSQVTQVEKKKKNPKNFPSAGFCGIGICNPSSKGSPRQCFTSSKNVAHPRLSRPFRSIRFRAFSMLITNSSVGIWSMKRQPHSSSQICILNLLFIPIAAWAQKLT